MTGELSEAFPLFYERKKTVGTKAKTVANKQKVSRKQQKKKTKKKKKKQRRANHDDDEDDDDDDTSDDEEYQEEEEEETSDLSEQEQMEDGDENDHTIVIHINTLHCKSTSILLKYVLEEALNLHKSKFPSFHTLVQWYNERKSCSNYDTLFAIVFVWDDIDAVPPGTLNRWMELCHQKFNQLPVYNVLRVSRVKCASVLQSTFMFNVCVNGNDDDSFIVFFLSIVFYSCGRALNY